MWKEINGFKLLSGGDNSYNPLVLPGRKNNNITPFEKKWQKINNSQKKEISFIFKFIDFSMKSINLGLFGGLKESLFPQIVLEEVCLSKINFFFWIVLFFLSVETYHNYFHLAKI